MAITNADVLFGFSNTSVSVVEGEGVVSVDIGIRGGAVSEPFQVQVFTSDGSAEGMCTSAVKTSCQREFICHYVSVFCL